MNNNVLVIAGMHRSGTSLITQWLYRCGLSVGEELMGEGIGNEEGHFEDMDFVRLHEGLLQQHDMSETGLWLEKPPVLTKEQQQQVAALVLEKNDNHAIWGWKDPRTCLFLPAYQQVLPQAKYLIIVRDYKEVVNSLLSREYKNAAQQYAQKGWFKRLLWSAIESRSRRKLIYRKLAPVFLKACVVYNEALLEHLKQIPASQRLVVDYTMLSKNDSVVFTHLQQQWQLPLSYRPFSDIYKAGLITPVNVFHPYIQDKALLQRAEHAERKLREVMG
ncbi:hypothetical protein HNQ91_005292 [Filimonas zeae]|uniref:Sulfotransferase family protein n=1 Tax=Filimonas zeae TaxID=1737353 RepID=A0A917J453_9BACT|nr:sulfotransferase [Filimonas zeae]MDR6342215.1 hypothetical protein [Filimonas zeae]GGH78652.1 hypothetical protein GCM10011379_46830 [Filimonas zeae]